MLWNYFQGYGVGFGALMLYLECASETLLPSLCELLQDLRLTAWTPPAVKRLAVWQNTVESETIAVGYVFFSHVSSWFRFNLFALIFFIPPRNHGLSFKDFQRFRVSPGVNIGMGAPSPQDTEADGCTTSTVSTAPSSPASSYHPGQVTSGDFGNVIKPWKPWKPWKQINKYPLVN